MGLRFNGFGKCFLLASVLLGCAGRPVTYDVRKAYYGSGELAEEALVSNRRLKEGKDIAYFKDGKVAAMAFYNSNHVCGPEVFLRKNGTVWKIEYHSDFGKSGPLLEFDTAGRLETSTTYRNGVKHGLYRVYYANGQILYKGNMKNGFPEGPREIYDSLGNPYNGLVEGRFHRGSPRFTGKVVNGKPDSSFTFYSEYKVCIKADFRNGVLHGEHKFISNENNDSSWYFDNGSYVKTVIFKKL